MLREYWRFFWPLALTGIVMVLGTQFQNGVLARYPAAVTELAIFAIASSIFSLLHAGVNFLSQMSNVYARSRHGLITTLQFVVLISTLLGIILSILAFTPVGPALIAKVYAVDADIVSRVVVYMKLFVPLIFIDGLRQFQMGLLVQSRMTGRVSILNAVYLSTIIASLVIGFNAGFSAPYVLAGSQIVASLVHFVLLAVVIFRDYHLPVKQDHQDLHFGELLRFFIPVSTTGLMFAISRPVLYALIARTPEAIVSIAAMRVGFDVSSLFQMTANQFRHFFVTFGDSHLKEKRLFMVLVGAGITVIMLLIAATPLSTFLLSNLIGITGNLLAYSREVLLIMCILPGLILWRNYYHGLLMIRRKTTGMALGGIARVLGIYLFAQVFYVLGHLNYLTGASILLLGIFLEAIIVMIIYRRFVKPESALGTEAQSYRQKSVASTDSLPDND